jgi:hypothetical protein
MITRDRKDGGAWTCWGISIGRLVRVHWHVGHTPEGPDREPWFRWRQFEVCGWMLPLKYHVV